MRRCTRTPDPPTLMPTPPTDPFQHIADPTLLQFARLGVLRSHRKGTVVIHEGDVGDTVHVILSGKVKVYVSDDDGRELVLGTRGAGEYFGELVISGGQRSASVTCLEPSTFSVVTRTTLDGFLRANPEFAMTLIAGLIAHLRLVTDLVKDLALRDVYQRLARLLTQLAVEQPDGRMALAERLSQSEIARRIGASRDMVNRIVRELVGGGYLAMDDGRIVLSRKTLPISF